MARAIWNGVVLAESDTYEKVEGNIYFPPDSISKKYFRESDTHSTCVWKGLASYYDVQVDGEINKDAAWYYPDPNLPAANIKGYIAFWRGVKVSE